MSFKYDRLFALMEKKGITTYYLRKHGIVGNETLRKLKNNTGTIDTRTLDNLCSLLGCQPGDIMEHIPSTEGEDAQ